MLRNIIFIAFFALAGVSLIFPTGVAEAGNGNIITVNRPVSSSFSGIVLGIKGELRVYQSETTDITISIDSNLEEFVQTEVVNGILEIKSSRRAGIRPTENAITIHLPEITKLAVSGTGKIFLIDTIFSESLHLEISGSGEIEGEVECANLSANISGSGKMTLTGKSQIARFGASGTATYECVQMEANRLNITASGSVKALVNAIEYLELRISGTGNIQYRGSPIITLLDSGSAKISALN